MYTASEECNEVLKHTFLNNKPYVLITIIHHLCLSPSTDVCFGTIIFLVRWRLCLNLAILGKGPLCKLNFPMTFITVSTKRVFKSMPFSLWNSKPKLESKVLKNGSIMHMKLYNQFHNTWCSKLGSTYWNVIIAPLLYLRKPTALGSQLPYFPPKTWFYLGVL